MADARRRVAANVEGNFFVDSSCINCKDSVVPWRPAASAAGKLPR